MTGPRQVQAGPFEEAAAGALDVLPIAVSAWPFGLLLGSLAAQQGLSPLEMAVMSATVFAGSAQFVAVKLWEIPAPVVTVAAVTLLVNLRHLLMGAALAPHFREQSSGRLLAALFFMADEIWALALRRTTQGRLTLAYYGGLSLLLWGSWVAATTTGALAGAFIAEPERYGLDFAFTALFLALLATFWKGRRTLAPWVVSALVAVVTERLLPGAWYILLGGLAGAAVGALRLGRP